MAVFYSHGGANALGWPAVSSSATGPGRPVFGGDVARDYSIAVVVTGGTGATVKIEGNSVDGPSTTGIPDPNTWLDLSAGGFSIDAGSSIWKSVPYDVRYVRTNVVSNGGGTVVSFVPPTPKEDSEQISDASYPAITNVATQGQ